MSDGDLLKCKLSNTSKLNTLITGRIIKGNGQTFNHTGPRVDTILVLYNQAFCFDFDAYNPGEYIFHCHNDFHLENGIMITIWCMYEDYCKTSTSHELFKGGINKYPTKFCNMGDCTPSNTVGNNNNNNNNNCNNNNNNNNYNNNNNNL